MDEVQTSVATARENQDTDARLAARLKQLLHTPGISDKDRKLIDRNLQRLIEALERRKPEAGASA